MIKIYKGLCPTEGEGLHIVHCVPANFKGGGGFAAHVPQIHIDHFALSEKAEVGDVIITEDKETYYHLITKQSYGVTVDYLDVRECIEILIEHLVNSGINEIYSPLLGCGIDGLNWQNVHLIIQNALEEYDKKNKITWNIYFIDPPGVETKFQSLNDFEEFFND